MKWTLNNKLTLVVEILLRNDKLPFVRDQIMAADNLTVQRAKASEDIIWTKFGLFNYPFKKYFSKILSC